MKHTLIIIALLASAFLPSSAKNEAGKPRPSDVLEIINRVNYHWQQTQKAEIWAFWHPAAYHTGNMEAYFLTGNKDFLDYSMKWAEHNRWQGATGTDRSKWRYDYGERPDYVLFGDWQICFQTYADLFTQNPDPQRIARAREVMEYEMSTEKNDYWWWADGLYMVMPVMTKMYNLTGNTLYLEKLYEYWQYANSIMYDADARLYYRDAKYVFPKHKSLNGKKDFWARGDGWVLAGLAKVLKDLPEDWQHRAAFLQRFKDMAQAVKACQQAEGYWTRSMLDAEHAPGPETSGTAFFTYGLLWGVNSGTLDRKEYWPVIMKAWKYLTETALQEDGSVGYVQPIGEKAIPGQIVNKNSTADFGVGAFLLAACEMARACSMSEVGKGYSQTSVNTAIFRTNSIVSKGDWQFIAYYDADGYLTLGKRKLGTDNWTVQRSQYKGNVKDAHNVISIMLDGKGYLHVSFDHHGHPLKYCRSLKPYGLELGALEAMINDNRKSITDNRQSKSDNRTPKPDETDVTYPEFYALKNGDLLFAYRSGASGRGNLVLNRYSVKKKKWSRVQDILIDGENQRNAYWQMYVDENSVIHLSWVWRETWNVETNHDLCYACSKDGGRTWLKSNGERYKLPINKDNAEYAWRIPQNSELINQTSMTAADGHPYIATYWREKDSAVPQYRLVWHDGRQWQCRQVSNRRTPFSLKGGGTKMIPIARPRMVVDKENLYYLFRDAERGSKVSMFKLALKDIAANTEPHSPSASQPQSPSASLPPLPSVQPKVMDLTSFSVNAWEPSLDTELWKSRHQLHVFVQRAMQGDGERAIKAAPQPVMVFEGDVLF